MNPIYQIKNGAYVDLSKIVAVHESKADFCVRISFQLIDKPVEFFDISTDGRVIPLDEMHNDIIEHWQKFVNSQITGIIKNP